MDTSTWNRNGDLNLSAFLLFSGFQFAGVEIRNEKICFFFLSSPAMKAKKDEYFSGKALVDPREFCKLRQFLRREIKKLQDNTPQTQHG